MKRDRKKDNKGFTLVELIIVIAILAILAATVGLSLTKYIARSREATDKAAAETLKTSIDAALAHEDAYDAAKALLTGDSASDKDHDTDVITFGVSAAEAVATVFADYTSDFYNELASIIGPNLPASKTGNGFTCTMKYETTKSITVTVVVTP